MNDKLYHKHLISLCMGLFLAIMSISCSTVKYLPAESTTKEIINYVDSIRFEVRDSVILIPREYYKDYTSLLDTLVLKSSRSEAKCWIDTTYHTLNGSLENEPEIPYKRQIEYRDRIVERTDTVVVYKKEPYPVEKIVKVVPKWCWYCLGFSILMILSIILYIYLKLKKIF